MEYFHEDVGGPAVGPPGANGPGCQDPPVAAIALRNLCLSRSRVLALKSKRCKRATSTACQTPRACCFAHPKRSQTDAQS